MASGNRDENWVVVGMGVSSDDGTTPVPITVDPVTGRLRCVSVSTDGGNATPTANKPPKRDENGVPVMAGVTDDANATVTPVSLHNGAVMMQAN